MTCVIPLFGSKRGVANRPVEGRNVMAIDITSETYRLTKTLQRSERYGLVQQMNRASVSIASNIAEGAGRGDSRDFARFVRIARGSACELEAQATMAARVGLVDGESARVLRKHLEKLKASLTNLERRMSLSPP